MKELIDLGFKKDTEFNGYRYYGAFGILYMSYTNKLYIFHKGYAILYFDYDIDICKLYIEGYEKFRQSLYSIFHSNYTEYLDMFINIQNKRRNCQVFTLHHVLGNKKITIDVNKDIVMLNGEVLKY